LKKLKKKQIDFNKCFQFNNNSENSSNGNVIVGIPNSTTTTIVKRELTQKY